MKVARVVTLGSRRGLYGGPWSTACRQCATLQKANEEPCLVFGFVRGDRPVIAFPSAAAEVTRWLPVGRFSGLFSFRILLNGFSAVRRSDVVHVSLARDLIPLTLALAALFLRKPIIVQPHGMLDRSSGRFAGAVDVVVRAVLARAVCVICLTGSEAQDLTTTFGLELPCVVLGNAVPDSLLQVPPAHNQRVEVLYLARVNARKRPDIFVEAASIAGASNHEPEWVMVGPDGGALQAALDYNSTLGNPVSYEEPVSPDSVYERVAQTDIFVLPAWREPWGNVLVAALALGKAVVLTRSSALAPLISSAGAGVVVPDGDAQSLAAVVLDLTVDPDRRAHLGAAGRTLAREALVDSVLAAQLLEVYAEAKSGSRP